MVESKEQKLPELTLIDQMEALAEDYKARHGRLPTNVSHWDPSRETVERLRLVVPALQFFDPVPYRYSYLLERKAQVLEKMGFSMPNVRGLVTENGSSSIAAVANWLAISRIRQVALLRPCYFITSYNLRRLGLPVRELSVPHSHDTYSMPTDLKLDKGEALWLTNPIYNTGVYSFEPHLDLLARFADAGVVIVADEALALMPSRIAAALGSHPNFVGIYTPHKSLCINGLKFSTIAFHPSHEGTFDDWADVLSGGLSLSATMAVEHFLGRDFDVYQSEFLKLIDQTRAWHDALIAQFAGRIRTDAVSRGHFLSVYVPRIEAQVGNDLRFLAELMEVSGSALIPGNRSGFDQSLGFCFRVNLARDSAQFRAALTRLYSCIEVGLHR